MTMTNDIGNLRSAIPAHLQGKEKTARIGNIDSSDLVIPRIKLMQAVSPELTTYANARQGEFWHTILCESLGKELVGAPLVMRKTQVLWAPRGDDRGILARSRNGKTWDPPHGEFKVKFKGNAREYTWRLAPTVAESGLDQFGSSRDDDPDSPPAAALTYELLWWFPELGLYAIILNSRGSAKPCQLLLSMIDLKPMDHFYQLYSIKSIASKGPDGEPYYNYSYTGLGYTDAAESVKTLELYERFKDAAFRASDEMTDTAAPPTGHAGQTAQRTADSKF
jgi:hypothetical protein